MVAQPRSSGSVDFGGSRGACSSGLPPTPKRQPVVLLSASGSRQNIRESNLDFWFSRIFQRDGFADSALRNLIFERQNQAELFSVAFSVGGSRLPSGTRQKLVLGVQWRALRRSPVCVGSLMRRTRTLRFGRRRWDL